MRGRTKKIITGLGGRVRLARAQNKWSLTEASRRLGLTRSFLWDVEQDKRGISAVTALRMADVYTVGLDWLLRGAKQ